MNSKTMLFECLGYCKETYLADNLCDGYRCPKCNGYVTERGFIKDLEEGIREMRNKIKKAKKNGLIRNYYKYYILPKPPLPPKLNNYISGVDLSEKKDLTVNIILNAEEFNKDLINKLTKEIEEHKRSIGNYIQCSYD